jgi:hypothetical protein
VKNEGKVAGKVGSKSGSGQMRCPSGRVRKCRVDWGECTTVDSEKSNRIRVSVGPNLGCNSWWSGPMGLSGTVVLRVE